MNQLSERFESSVPAAAEWLETDGRGGFASGTVSGQRTRRYHALLLVARTPPTGRLVLVNGFDALVRTQDGEFALSSQFYAPGVLHPDGASRRVGFEIDPWPRWTFLLENGARIVQEIFVPSGRPAVVVTWRALDPMPRAELLVRPFLSGRDYHALHRENPSIDLGSRVEGERVVWQPYRDLPAVVSLANARFGHEPLWYRNFLYEEEHSRGLDDIEDLASPGTLRWDLSTGDAVWILAADLDTGAAQTPGLPAAELAADLRASEARRRRSFPSRLHRSAEAYLARRGTGKTIVAGYPWFTDWGRDTFIALRGLCIAGGRLDDARAILLEWAEHISEGMLPNRFPDHGEEPQFNSVDASLWYVIAVGEFLEAASANGALHRGHRQRLEEAVETILRGYSAGTRHGIRMTPDGLLAAGEPGEQLTWMDARVGDWVVTPRIGKPVEVEALWLNALAIASRFSPRWAEILERGRRAFGERFWNDAGGSLHDVVDCDHRPGTVDWRFRPNQIFAVGGLPLVLLPDDRARAVVDAVESRLWTPLGLRSLAPGEPGYVGRYEGGVLQRDGAYHQGTVWPWLIGPFVEAWVRVRGRTARSLEDARARFVEPLLRHLDEAGLGHISEIADADAPHTPRGCPFQAWSLGELLRLEHAVLGARADRGASRPSSGVVPPAPARSRADEGS